MTTLTDPDRQFVLAVKEAIDLERRCSASARVIVHMNRAGLAVLNRLRFTLRWDAAESMMGYARWAEADVLIRITPSADSTPIFHLAVLGTKPAGSKNGGTVWSKLRSRVLIFSRSAPTVSVPAARRLPAKAPSAAVPAADTAAAPGQRTGPRPPASAPERTPNGNLSGIVLPA